MGTAGTKWAQGTGGELAALCPRGARHPDVPWAPHHCLTGHLQGWGTWGQSRRALGTSRGTSAGLGVNQDCGQYGTHQGHLVAVPVSWGCRPRAGRVLPAPPCLGSPITAPVPITPPSRIPGASTLLTSPRSRGTHGCRVPAPRRSHSHGNEAGHGGAEAVKDVAHGQRHEVVHEGADGEDEGELLVLPAAVCKAAGTRGHGDVGTGTAGTRARGQEKQHPGHQAGGQRAGMWCTRTAGTRGTGEAGIPWHRDNGDVGMKTAGTRGTRHWGHEAVGQRASRMHREQIWGQGTRRDGDGVPGAVPDSVLLGLGLGLGLGEFWHSSPKYFRSLRT